MEIWLEVDLNLKDYFEDAKEYYLVDGDEKTLVDGGTYTFILGIYTE